MLGHIKELRETTFLSISDCKAAVEAVTATGEYDKEKAIEWLKLSGMLKAVRLETRSRGAGIIHAYIHHDKSIGVLLKITCETDFVARNEEFIALANNLCLHIVAASPLYINVTDVDKYLADSWKEACVSSMSPKIPEAKKTTVLEGMLDKTYYQQFVLMKQPYILEPKFKVEDIIKQKSASFGESIAVEFFVKQTVGRG